MRIYLAGPEVFFENPQAEADMKKRFLAELDHEGCFPLDNEIAIEASSAPSEVGLRIGRANVDLMNACDAIIANLSPWHGPSADVGTVAEIIYMGTLGKPVAAYSTGHPDFLARVEDQYRATHPGVDFVRADDGRLFAPDGYSVEEFGLFDNLMLPHFLEMWGTSIQPNFEAAARELAKRLERIASPAL